MIMANVPKKNGENMNILDEIKAEEMKNAEQFESKTTNESGYEFTGAKEPKTIDIDFSRFLNRTGEGDIDQYKNHLMNPFKSEWVAHILRGVTGIVGTDINLALIDIAIGLFKMQLGKAVKPSENK